MGHSNYHGPSGGWSVPAHLAERRTPSSGASGVSPGPIARLVGALFTFGLVVVAAVVVLIVVIAVSQSGSA